MYGHSCSAANTKRCRRWSAGARWNSPSRYLADIPAQLLNVKSAQVQRSAEESQELRKNFFASMKEMLAGEDQSQPGA